MKLIDDLEKLGIILTINDGRLVIDAPKGVLTEDRVRLIKDYKESIVEELTSISINQNVIQWPVTRQRQFSDLAQSYQNPDRGFGIKVQNLRKTESQQKAYDDLKAFAEEEQQVKGDGL